MPIDEYDAIETKRYGGDQQGDQEGQRTMLELLNRLGGFSFQRHGQGDDGYKSSRYTYIGSRLVEKCVIGSQD